MILEAIILHVKKTQTKEFEAAFSQAKQCLQKSKGYIKHSLHRCLEIKSQYILQIYWENLEAHTVEFRNSEQFKIWRGLLHHFYEPKPEVFHYEDLTHTL